MNFNKSLLSVPSPTRGSMSPTVSARRKNPARNTATPVYFLKFWIPLILTLFNFDPLRFGDSFILVHLIQFAPLIMVHPFSFFFRVLFSFIRIIRRKFNILARLFHTLIQVLEQFSIFTVEEL